ncbi:hypothetical protein CC86DRAFT_59106 [Ophiobolus disseminans]|uniref:CorA-like transporter domain-containing protein n=1 Tax=Ophiobolus disseminans TaxID=1469910 RepID=A0A6A6ZRM6_9PLEO|nr:hypothetical protein CC86DRAFT_59106 [Ophiobolus disseminans]
MLPPEFQRSYRERLNYPESLVPGNTSIYSSKLKSYRRRLDDAEAELCLIDGKDDVANIFDIPIIDLETHDGKAMRNQNIHSASKLTKWFGVELSDDPGNPGSQQVIAKKKDPKCRLIYIYGEHSRDKLKTTRSSLAEIMTYHQVMPAYLDFMLVFGAQSDPKDLRFSGFREQVRLKIPSSAVAMPTLGRSGRHYQLCYNLKSVQKKSKSSESIILDEWSIRQTAVYHHFDVESGTCLWIVTKGGDDLLEQYEELIGPNGRPEDKQYKTPGLALGSSLSTHLLFCHWSTEDWRWYSQWLEEVLDHVSDMAVYGPRGEGYAHKEYKPYHIQDLQHWQDKANEAVMVLEANTDVLKSIHKFYLALIDRKDFPDTLKLACEEDLRTFISQLDEIINDFHMQVARAKLLVTIISDRKELILQHLQGQAAERTEKLNKNLEREAVVMRIVTIVTLVYLPATFTSTFFSTDVVKYQDQDDNNVVHKNGSYSPLALERWLQVTLPLTALTLLVAWSTYKMYDTSRSGMTASERIKDICSNAMPTFVTPSDKAQTPLYGTIRLGGSSRTDSAWPSARLVSNFLKPIRAHTRWPQKIDSPLPLHDMGNTKTGP